MEQDTLVVGGASSDEQRRSEFDIIFEGATKIKEEGNEAFKSKNYKEAVEIYSCCLDCVLKARATLKKDQSQEGREKKPLSQGHESETPLISACSPEKDTSPSFSTYEERELRQRAPEAPTKRGGGGERGEREAERGGDDERRRASPRTETGQCLTDTSGLLDALETQVLCNRALCYLRQELFDAAEEDCTSALALDASNVKALYRRACAREGLERYRECVSDLQLLFERGGRPGDAANIRQQQQQMLCRVRDKLLRQEQLETDQQQPQALITAALSANTKGKSLSAAERVQHVKRATGLLLQSHSRPGSTRLRFLKDGALLCVADYLATASPGIHHQRQEQQQVNEKKKNNQGEEQVAQEGCGVDILPGELPQLTPALEAACWDLLLRCVVDERAQEKVCHNQETEKTKKKFLSSGGNASDLAEESAKKRWGKHDTDDPKGGGFHDRLGCTHLLRQKWTSEQLLLRLRRLLNPQTKRQVYSRTPLGDKAQLSWDEGKHRGDAVGRVDIAETERCKDTDEDKHSVDNDRHAAAASACAAHAWQHKKEKNKGGVGMDDDNAGEKEEEYRIQASCSVLRLMGQLEQVSANCFEDDAAFCTGCLLGMQYTGSVEVRLAALDAATTVATARRNSPLHAAPVLALRQNVEKLLEELLQQFEELVESEVIDSRENQLELTWKKKKEQKKVEDTGGRQQVDHTYLQSREGAAQRQRLQAQIECLLVTLLSLLVDKNRPLPPLFAAARQSNSKGEENDANGTGRGGEGQPQKSEKAAKTAELDTGRLLEQLLTPYLPLSACMLLYEDNNSNNNNSTCSSEGGTANTNDSDFSERRKNGDSGGGKGSITRTSSADEEINKRHHVGSKCMWKGSDVEEAVVRQIVGLKVLRLLLPAAREEVSQFLVNDTCGALRFAVAASADDEGVRLAHTPRMLWLQQQAAAADLLIPSMDFPELRHKVVQCGGVQALATALSSCCSQLPTTEKQSSLPVVSLASTMETAMSWVLCGKVAAILARLAVHHENVRVEVFDFVNFYDVLSRLLQHWEEQQRRAAIEAGSSGRTSTARSSEKREDEVKSAAASAADRRGKTNAAAAGGAEASAVAGEDAVMPNIAPRGIRAVIADLEQHALCQDFSQVFCFVSLHASFKERLVKDEGGMLPRLVRLVDAAFVAVETSSSSAKGKDSSSRNLILFLLLQGLSNLMKSRDDPRKRLRSSRNRGGPQLDEEQQEQLEEFFSRLPPEAQPPRNGQVDAGDSEVARCLKERLAGYGVVRVLTGIIMSNLKAAATAAAQKEEEAEQYNINSSSAAAAAAAAALQQQLSPNALIAGVDLLSSLSAPPVHRGCVLREGGLRTLLAVLPFLEKHGSTYESEQRDARQAIARLCISANPTLLTYQETLEAITCVVPLLRDEHELLQYEAALAVTNLTSSAVEAQNHAWNLGAWSALEDMLFSDNPLLRAAGLEGWCNLAASDVVQEAIGNRCDELWQAECKSLGSAIENSKAAGEHKKTQASASEEKNKESIGTNTLSPPTDKVAIVSSSQYELQYIKILLAYCLEDENVRGRHAAIAALAMLVADCRTAAAVVRSSNFRNLFRSLDDAELITPEERDNGSEKSRYEGDTLILRIVATLNHIWGSLKEADDRRGCNFQVLTEQLRALFTRNHYKLTGVSNSLAQEICAN